MPATAPKAAPKAHRRGPWCGVVALLLLPATVFCSLMGGLLNTAVVLPAGGTVSALLPGVSQAATAVQFACILGGVAAAIGSVVLGERPTWPAYVALGLHAAVFVLGPFLDL